MVHPIFILVAFLAGVFLALLVARQDMRTYKMHSKLLEQTLKHEEEERKIRAEEKAIIQLERDQALRRLEELEDK